MNAKPDREDILAFVLIALTMVAPAIAACLTVAP